MNRKKKENESNIKATKPFKANTHLYEYPAGSKATRKSKQQLRAAVGKAGLARQPLLRFHYVEVRTAFGTGVMSEEEKEQWSQTKV